MKSSLTNLPESKSVEELRGLHPISRNQLRFEQNRAFAKLAVVQEADQRKTMTSFHGSAFPPRVLNSKLRGCERLLQSVKDKSSNPADQQLFTMHFAKGNTAMIVNRLAWVALVSVIVLVVVGATVRVTGSGLGCPDWPTCWGCLIPPTSVEQIDVDKLDLEKFKRHAERKGIDPDTITRDTILASFNPVHTWIEFGNRLTSLPLGFSALFLALVSFRAKKYRFWIVALSWLALFDVMANAVMGAVVVRSGLHPGIITLHMALAFLLIAILVTIIWLSRPLRELTLISTTDRRRLFIVSLVFFGCLFAEGLMGSQLREQTDELAKAAEGLARDQWIGELGSTLIYKFHRSFSWSLLLTSGLLLFWVRHLNNPKMVEPKFMFGLVVAMMMMGVVLGHIAVFQVVQVLHVGTTAILLALTWHWIVRLFLARA